MTIEEQLKPIIEKAMAAAEATGEFVVDQAPILLQEFYTWHTALHALGCFISLFFMFGLPLIMRAIAQKETEGSWTINFLGKTIDDELGIAFYIIGGFSFIIGVIMFFIDLAGLIKITVAPRLYIIEYFLAN
jgi:hypothetical protein